MSEIFSVQLTAVFTAILGVGAIVTAVLAALAFRKQSQEVGLLLEQAKRDTDERRRAQAARVLLGIPPDTGPPVSPYARNASDLPVYEATIRYTGPARIPEPEYLGAIMPGDTATAAELFSGSQARKYTVLTFRDAAGIHWVRWPDGALVEQGSPMSGTDLVAVKRLLDFMAERDPEHRNAAGYPQATGGPLRRAARAVLRKLRPHGQGEARGLPNIVTPSAPRTAMPDLQEAIPVLPRPPPLRRLQPQETCNPDRHVANPPSPRLDRRFAETPRARESGDCGT